MWVNFLPFLGVYVNMIALFLKLVILAGAKNQIIETSRRLQRKDHVLKVEHCHCQKIS
jgi:hypothetical protein